MSKVKFRLSGTVTISIYTEVDADSLEQAIKIAEDREIEQSHWGDKDQCKTFWLYDEIDGEPCKIIES